MTQMAPLTEKVLDASPDLRLFCISRGGPVNANIPAATEHGVAVTYAPGRNATATAEQSVGIRTGEGVASVKQHAAGAYSRALDPTPLAGVRPGAAVAAVAGCLAVGGGTTYCVSQGVDPVGGLARIVSPAAAPAPAGKRSGGAAAQEAGGEAAGRGVDAGADPLRHAHDGAAAPSPQPTAQATPQPTPEPTPAPIPADEYEPVAPASATGAAPQPPSRTPAPAPAGGPGEFDGP